MMRDEDPLVMAQKQVRTLSEQIKQGAVDGSQKAERKAGAGETSSSLRGMPDFNKWLFGLAGMLLAAIGVAVAVIRPSKGAKSVKSASPWWQAGSDSVSRELDLVKAAREQAREANRAHKAGVMAEQAARLQAEMAATGEDAALERYVNQYVRKKPDSEAAGAGAATVAMPEEPAAAAAAAAAIEPSAPAGQRPLQGAPLEVTSASAQPANDAASELLTVDPRHAKLATFEEISDVMQEAEFWKMLNETQRAIDILEQYCGSANADSPVPWLYLFDLYIENGDAGRHADLRARFQAKFNSQIPEHSDHVSLGQHSLEDYPYLMEQISALWGQAEVVAFLQSLLLNSRNEPRQGFDLLVYREILMLIELAREREKQAA